MDEIVRDSDEAAAEAKRRAEEVCVNTKLGSRPTPTHQSMEGEA